MRFCADFYDLNYQRPKEHHHAALKRNYRLCELSGSTGNATTTPQQTMSRTHTQSDDNDENDGERARKANRPVMPTNTPQPKSSDLSEVMSAFAVNAPRRIPHQGYHFCS
ncbi:unnamed protein product [Ceratitis capitata]|uniref:(Mediterranean fruit fly) hypothetical protein n=1 Tax=Ceratitis capitata TaxID=7213 RepID=A0A811V7A7_CERCA|nr:unnamed protein product [Ceratitis capitata]